MQKRNLVFVQESLKILEKLEKDWFQPGLKSPEGYFYGCGYCDMECGNHKNHDKDCLPQMAKNLLEKVMVINLDPSYNYDYKNQPRNEKDAQELRAFFIKDLLLKEFFAPILSHLVPLDYSDPVNKSIICSCYHLNVFKTKQKRTKHHSHCVYIQLAQIFSNLYKT